MSGDSTRVVHAGMPAARQGEPFLPGPTLQAGNHWAGAADPAAYGRMEDFMRKDGTIKRTVPPESLLIARPGFVEAINQFDHQAVVDAAKACKGA